MTATKNRPLRYRPDTEDRGELEPGEFCYCRDDDGRVASLSFWPCDSDSPLTAMMWPSQNKHDASFVWSGTMEAPTLTPSVNALGRWHGWLKNGVAQQ